MSLSCDANRKNIKNIKANIISIWQMLYYFLSNASTVYLYVKVPSRINVFWYSSETINTQMSAYHNQKITSLCRRGSSSYSEAPESIWRKTCDMHYFLWKNSLKEKRKQKQKIKRIKVTICRKNYLLQVMSQGLC